MLSSRRTNLKFNSVALLLLKSILISLQSPWFVTAQELSRFRICDFSHTLFLSLFCCSIFKDQTRCLFATAFQVYHKVFRLSSTFPKVFWLFSKFFSRLFSAALTPSPLSIPSPLFQNRAVARPRFRSACLIYHFFPLLSTTFYYLFCLHYTPPGVSSICWFNVIVESIIIILSTSAHIVRNRSSGILYIS